MYDPLGLYLAGGEVTLVGVRQPVEDEVFTGGALHTVRFVRPAEDGLNCAERLMITLETLANESTCDAQGQLVIGAGPGTGTVTVEAKQPPAGGGHRRHAAHRAAALGRVSTQDANERHRQVPSPAGRQAAQEKPQPLGRGFV